MRRTDREQDAVRALMKLVSRETGETFEFDHHPDEAPGDGQRPKAPDYLFRGRARELMVEHTALARHVPSQQRRVHASRMYSAIGTTSWPAGSYCVDILTDDARRVERLVRSGRFAILIQAASRLTPLQALGSVEAQMFAFHARDSRYYVGDADGVLLLSKRTETGSGYWISGPHETALPDGEMLRNRQGAVVRLPTTSRSLLDVEYMSQRLEELFQEAEEKFRYREGCRSVLLIDLAAYVAGPILVVNAICALPPSNWPRVTASAVYVDEPYSDPPPPSGEVSGAYRMWLVGTLTGTS